MRDLNLVHRGSTKDIYSSGENYLFHFSDRYSVFDWGEMPDHLNGKGLALAELTKSIFSHLEGKGIDTHRLNVDCKRDEMVVKPFKVIRDQKFMPQEENIFIPLEVIFRLGVAEGSSLLKRGFKLGERFSTPMIEFTTKLERFDRPLNPEEAKSLANLNDHEWKTLLETTKLIALELESLFKSFDITLWDGKVEFALGEFGKLGRKIILVDSIGPDEMRLDSQGVQLSKEVIRQFYRQTEWFQKLEATKSQHGVNFKNHIAHPPKLPASIREAVEDMYLLLPDLFSDAQGAKRKLQDLLPRLKEIQR